MLPYLLTAALTLSAANLVLLAYLLLKGAQE